MRACGATYEHVGCAYCWSLPPGRLHLGTVERTDPMRLASNTGGINPDPEKHPALSLKQLTDGPCMASGSPVVATTPARSAHTHLMGFS